VINKCDSLPEAKQPLKYVLISVIVYFINASYIRIFLVEKILRKILISFKVNYLKYIFISETRRTEKCPNDLVVVDSEKFALVVTTFDNFVSFPNISNFNVRIIFCYA